MKAPRAGCGARGGSGRDLPGVAGADPNDGQADPGRGKRRLGLGGRVPRRGRRGHQGGRAGPAGPGDRDGLDAGGRVPGARTGQIARLAAAGRRAAGRLDDRAPSGPPRHGLLAEEVDEIVALFQQWGRPTGRIARWAPLRLAAGPAVGVVCGRSTSSRITAPSITGRSVASIRGPRG